MVMGDDFKASRASDAELSSTDKAAATARSALESEAKSLGISRINLDKLMGWLRSSGNDISALGSGMQPNILDFKPATRESTTSGRVSPLFMNRDGSLNKALKSDAK